METESDAFRAGYRAGYSAGLSAKKPTRKQEKARILKNLADSQTPLIKTNRQGGAEYSTLSGRAVNKEIAESITGQADLFSLLPSKPILTATQDGLFPGFSQTWRLTK